MFPCVLEVPISLRSRQHLSLSSECSRPVGVQWVSLVVTCSSLLPGGVKRHFMGFLPYVHFPSCSRWLWPGLVGCPTELTSLLGFMLPLGCGGKTGQEL